MKETNVVVAFNCKVDVTGLGRAISGELLEFGDGYEEDEEGEDCVENQR